MNYGGFRVVESDLVPPGKLYVMNRAALEPVEWRYEGVESEATGNAFAAELSATFRFSATEEERDPISWPPRRWRGYPRWLARIVAYEFRKAAGTLRRVPKNRSYAILSNLDA